MASSNFRVLLVEENVELATPIAAALDQAGFKCQYVPQTGEAMAAFDKQPFHLVLLSLSLPRIGSASLCSPLRQKSSVPIVMLSVRTRREDHLHALKIGADEFITIRPYDEQILLARILTLMRRVYQYRQPSFASLMENETLPGPQSSLPAGWATCEFCNYMGPQGRFDRINAQGERALSCPHCDQNQGQQSVVFSLG